MLYSGGLLPASLRDTQRSLTWLCFLRPNPAMFLLLALLAALGGLLASQGKTSEPRLPSPSLGTEQSWDLPNNFWSSRIPAAPLWDSLMVASSHPQPPPDQDRGWKMLVKDAVSQPLKVFLGHLLCSQRT